MYHGGQLRDTSKVSEVGVKTIQQFRHLGSFTHPLSSSPSVENAGCRPHIFNKSYLDVELFDYKKLKCIRQSKHQGLGQR